MHGREGEEDRRKRNLHMWTVPSRGNSRTSIVAAAVDGSLSSLASLSSANSFSKGGRKISVGDCALFKPPQNSTPFIGIIRSLTLGKENKLYLGVNWLYRPAEIKLGKGILLEAAPNEIFYSFHKDEIPAATLLHPCKVAFLPKGVQLPSGLSSYVCRRVYDITSKRLWWLTDQNYINERQEEVDKLIHKTRIEMHAAVHTDGRSSKPMNGPTSTSQLKPGADNVLNSVSSFPSQVKGKKRERGDQGSEPVKRERSSKMDEGDSGNCRSETSFKSEIAKLSEKGGLVDFEGVEKLVQLFIPARSEKKLDLVCRSMLAGVIAATDKLDCLNRFVQLRGLPVLDEWLQEVHKGKIGDGSGSKDSDKAVEEFLLVLLHALDKLPVNLHALQMCNIGKSVNLLRSHKNLDIQKKARSLVDTWKKRVGAEMNINDVKSGSSPGVPWPARSRLSEVSHGGNRLSDGSSEVAVKSSVMQFSGSKTGSLKLIQGESTTKFASAAPGSMKLVPSPVSFSADIKDGQPRNAAVCDTSDLPLTPAKDERSSSSQSHNNSQSCSSEHAKTGAISGKEDARSSTAGSMSVNKVSGGSSRHRKSSNGFAALSGVRRETGSTRNSSFPRNSASEKLSQAGLTGEKAFDVPVAEGSSHKLVVKIPNRTHSLAQNASGRPSEDPLIMNSRAASPMLQEKHDQFDTSSKEKSDTRANSATDINNNESWQSNDSKGALAVSDEGDGSPARFLDDECCRTGNGTRKTAEASKTASSSSGSELKTGKLHEVSFSSINALIGYQKINALIDSCVKYSNTNVSTSTGEEDGGINLLASVAAGEISKSEQVSPTDSPQRASVVDHLYTGNDSKVKSSPGDDLAESRCNDGNIKFEEKPDQSLGSSRKWNDTIIPASVAGCPANWEGAEHGDTKVAALSISDAFQKVTSSSLAADKDSGVIACEVMMGAVERSLSRPSLETDVQTEQKLLTMTNAEYVKGTNDEVLLPSCSDRDLASEDVVQPKPNMTGQTDARSCVDQIEQHNADRESTAPIAPGDRGVSSLDSSSTHHKGEYAEEKLESSDVHEQQSGQPATQMVSPRVLMPEKEQCLTSKVFKLTSTEADECTSTTADATLFSAAGGSDMGTKVEFDLNEGFNDDGKNGEHINLTAHGSAAVQAISPLPFPVSSVSTCVPTSITVAAAARGPFVPLEDLLRSKGEPGWKGSAKTSAFRPAEPRKVLEGSTNVSPPDATAGKRSRLHLDIDLNVPDERTLEDINFQTSVQDTGFVSDHTNNSNLARDELMASAPGRYSGGLDLDLNRADDATDMVHYSTSNGCRLDVPLLPAKSLSGGFPNGKLSARRDFDLNDGPGVDEVTNVPSPFSQLFRNSVPSQPPVSGLRMNNTDIGNFSSWFPPGNNYSAVTVPSVLPDRGHQSFPIVASGAPQMILAPPAGGPTFSPDVYRGPVLSSSPAMSFPSTPFQYPVFPFGTSFPLPSATFPIGSAAYVDSSSGGRLCFPAVHSQFLGSAGAVSSNYRRPYLIGLPDGNIGSLEGSRKWGSQSLDLNAGPGGQDIEGRDDTLPLSLRQLSGASSQAFADEQSRMYQVAGGVLKRKEPEGGWESYKQPWGQ